MAAKQVGGEAEVDGCRVDNEGFGQACQEVLILASIWIKPP